MIKSKHISLVKKTRRSTMRPQATFSFFIFFTLLSSSLLPPRRSFLRVHPSSASILPPRPSFRLVPPSSTFPFLPRPALSKSYRIRKRPVFIDLDESVTDGPTDRPTNGRTDKASYRDARTHLKRLTSRLSRCHSCHRVVKRRTFLQHFFVITIAMKLCPGSGHALDILLIIWSVHV